MLWGREPTAIISALRGILYVVVLFGFSLSEEQIIAILVAAEAVLTLVNRAKVTPVRPA